MLSVRQALDAAWQHYQTGQWQQAEQLYLQVLEVDPDQIDALHLLAAITGQTGRESRAITYLQAVLRLQPGLAAAHNNLGNAFSSQGRFPEAVASFQEAVRLQPDFAVAYSNLGNAQRKQGRLAEAVASLQQAVRLKPDFAGAHNNLGAAWLALEKLADAQASFQQAVRLKPDFAEAHFHLGVALGKGGKHEEATASLQQALRLKPDYAEAHYSLGVALERQEKHEEAVASYQQAVRLDPDYADAHYNLGLVSLLLGDFEQGWGEYEWRWKTKEEFVDRSFSQPRWDGGRLEGKTILLHAEQGLGDTLQFIRYAPLVHQRGARVVVCTFPPLLSLLRTCPGIDHLLAGDEPLPSFDIHAPLLSLPLVFGTTAATVPADVPYLAADPCLVTHWQSELNALPGFKVGIVWQGFPGHKKDHLRSVPLMAFAPLADLADVHLVSLQVGLGREQVAALGGLFRIADVASRFDAASFGDAAAVVKCLDLVITVDSALAHLAGALGVLVWVALPYNPDWRWMLEREDSPWYPTMRLFRQARPGDWAEVFGRIAVALKRATEEKQANNR